jgi:hypothetical protein
MVAEAYNHFYTLVPFFACIFGLLLCLSHKSRYSAIDGAFTDIIVIASSLTLVLLLVQIDLISADILYRYLWLHLVAFLGIFVASQFYQLRKSNVLYQPFINSSSNYRNVTLLLNASFLIYILSQGFLSYQMRSNALAAAERLTLAKQYTLIQFLAYASFPVFSLCLSLVFFAKKKFHVHHILQILFCGLVSIYSGSKAGILSLGLIFLSVNPLELKIKRRNILVLLVIALMVGSVFISSMIVNAATPQEFFDKFIYDLLMRGDIYLLMFVNSKIEYYYHQYDFFSYFAHPFLLPLGMRGYDLPLGTQLLKDVTGSDVGGANTHLALLTDVLLQGDFLLASLFCFTVGVIIHLLKYFYGKILLRFRISLLIKLVLFVPSFFATTILLDPSVYAYLYVVSPLFFLIVISPLCFLSRRGKRGKSSDRRIKQLRTKVTE